MDGKRVALSLLVIAFATETEVLAQGPVGSGGIKYSKVAELITKILTAGRKVPSYNILCPRRTYLCFEQPKENCECVPYTKACPPPRGNCPEGLNETCHSRKPGESCRCVCERPPVEPPEIEQPSGSQ
uniref:Putative dermacentor 9 kDa family member n=1 Tax=Rhipicephalus pulchellus TaxID=72859 RepID=L7MC69_RHIPC